MSNTSIPFWVRLQLIGIPDRITAIVLWWLMLATAIAVPAYCLVPGHLMPQTRVAAAIFLAAFITTVFTCFGQAIRWMDCNAAWHGR